MTQGFEMSFLEQFFEDNFDVPPTPPGSSGQADGSVPPSQGNSFKKVSDSELAAHLEVDTYDHFQLTDAVRPAMDLKIKPTEGYRHEHYQDEESGASIPVVMAAASKEKLFPLFMELIGNLGPVVDVVLESSHEGDAEGHRDFYRDSIDMAVLQSVLFDYEDLLLNDGCTGIAVLNPSLPQEVQLEEHKLLIVYGSPLEQYEFRLERAGVTDSPQMQFITEAEHVHSSSEKYLKRFEELRCDLGLDGSQTEPNENYLDDSHNDGENWSDGDMSGGLA
jgi:hypothetical protein